MGIEITAKVRCDRCEREQDVRVYGTPTNDRILSEANAEGGFDWKRLDDMGREVSDYRPCASVVLCGGCAEAYRAHVAARNAMDASFFGGAR